MRSTPPLSVRTTGSPRLTRCPLAPPGLCRRLRPLTWWLLALLLPEPAAALAEAAPSALAAAVAPGGVAPFELLRDGDWAYGELVRLAGRLDCPAPAQRRLLEARQPLSRFEAAALLQACLAAGAAAGDAVLRLQRELAAELAQLAGQLDGLQARSAELQASQFTTTSVLKADSRWWLGAVRYGGNQIDRASNSYGGRPLRDGFNVVYEVRFNVNTSFDGRDLLRLRLRAGNGGYSGFRSSPAPILQVIGVYPGSCEAGQSCRNNRLVLNKLYYQRPIGRHLRLTAGSSVSQKDMLGVWPSVFGHSDALLAGFDKAGAPGAYSDIKGTGVGLYWNQRAAAGVSPGFVVSGVHVARNGSEGTPEDGGLGAPASRGSGTLQLGYVGLGWAVAAVYTRNQAGALAADAMTPLARQTWPQGTPGRDGHVDAWGLSGFWQPRRHGWIPAISLGWGFNRNVYDRSGPDAASPLLAARSQSWMVGLNWFDAFDSDSELGLAIGTPLYLTHYSNPVGEQGVADHSLMLELWYHYQATDWLSITPGLFWLPRPRGQLTASGSSWDGAPLPLGQGAGFSALGALVKLRFKF